MNEEYLDKLDYGKINDDVLSPIKPAVPIYYIVLAVLGVGVLVGMVAWIYQVKTGMGVAGITHPVGWGIYITNFVFWIGIAHSGTLISAILHLVRAKWRDAVSRSAEAMTIIAVLCAGMYPLIHLGRLWVFYYIIPYPSERHIWPNFKSPLVWDLTAVFTYLTVSIIFFYVGLIPDAAAARDRFEKELGKDHYKSKIFRILSLGWSGAASQWRHYGRSYLFFAALATPLVISVHSIVSWDFAMSLLPGWHSTIFAPYFVAGAIHSGLAMVLTLVIPLRKILKLEKLITVDHFDLLARTMMVTTLILAYTYIIEPYIAGYSGNIFDWQFEAWKDTGPYGWIFWMILPLNVFIPLTFIFKKLRRNLKYLFIVSILVNVGMWFERLLIVIASTSHDFIPHNWGNYSPSWVEISIATGTLCFFLFSFLAFSKSLPTIPIADFKSQLFSRKVKIKVSESPTSVKKLNSKSFIRFVFSSPEALINAVKKIKEAGFERIETFTPVKMKPLLKLLGYTKSNVRLYTLIGGILGCASGYGLAIGTALVNSNIVGGKHPVAVIPYTVIAFELTILFGSIGNLIGLIINSKLHRTHTMEGYEERFSRDKFALLISGDHEKCENAKSILSEFNPEEIHESGS